MIVQENIDVLKQKGKMCIVHKEKVKLLWKYQKSIVKCNKNDHMIVDCTETILSMNKDTLHNVFQFISEIFPNEKCATQAVFLKAISYFLELFKEDIDIKKLKNAAKATKKRKILSASFLLDDSKNYVQYKGKPVKQISYALAISYQSRIKNGKLPLYKFDM